MSDSAVSDQASPPAGGPPAAGERTLLETLVHRLFAAYQQTGISTNEPFHDVMVAFCALGLATERGRHDLVASMRRETARLEAVAAEAKGSADRVERAMRLDVRSTVARHGFLLAGIVLASTLAGGIGAYSLLGGREAFVSRITVAEHLQRAYGLDEPSAQAWDGVIPLNDLRQALARCRESYYYYENGRRYCDLRLYVPTAPAKLGS